MSADRITTLQDPSAAASTGSRSAETVVAARPKPVRRRRGRPATGTAHAVPEQRLLDTAFEIFAERGYEGTTLRDMARRLEVSHSLLNVRFGTKENLWRRSLDAHVASRAVPVMTLFDQPGLDDEARLRAIIRGLCRWAADNPDLVGMTNAESRRDTWRLDYIIDAYHRPFKLRLDALLARIAVVRPVRRLSSSGLMAIMVQGIGFHFASRPLLQRVASADEIGPSQIDEQAALFADFILAGLLPDAPAARSARAASSRVRQTSR